MRCIVELLVAYDVATETAAGRRRLRRVAQICLGYGQRVQKSVFECTLTEMQLVQFTHRLLKHIDPKEDSLRIYRLREPRERYVDVYGYDPRVNYSDPLVV